MAEGWILLAGVLILGLVGAAAALLLAERHRAGATRGADRHDAAIALGPALVAVGITLGSSRPVGYAFFAAGVLVAMAWAVRRVRNGRV